MIFATFSEIFERLAEGCVRKIKRRCCKNKKFIQKDLNELMIGPDFNTHTRYAKAIMIIFLSFVYAPGLPILVLFAMIFLFIQYWMDKYMVLRVCKRPAFVDINSCSVALHLLPIILIAHLMNAFWTYGNHELFPGGVEEVLTIIDG